MNPFVTGKCFSRFNTSIHYSGSTSHRRISRKTMVKKREERPSKHTIVRRATGKNTTHALCSKQSVPTYATRVSRHYTSIIVLMHVPVSCGCSFLRSSLGARLISGSTLSLQIPTVTTAVPQFQLEAYGRRGDGSGAFSRSSDFVVVWFVFGGGIVFSKRPACTRRIIPCAYTMRAGIGARVRV